MSSAIGITAAQKWTAQAIVNVFETGRAGGDYGRTTVIPGDAGHLTYGRAQVTLASGNLGRLVENYCAQTNAAHADALRPYIEPLKRPDFALDTNAALRTTLTDAAADPVMRSIQDQFFDATFWEPARRRAAAAGIATPLGMAIIFDSCIQGGWVTVMSSVTAQHGRPPATPEQEWSRLYVNARREFLKMGRPPLPSTVYRMDAFAELIAVGNWDLKLPLLVRGVTIREPVTQ